VKLDGAPIDSDPGSIWGYTTAVATMSDYVGGGVSVVGIVVVCVPRDYCLLRWLWMMIPAEWKGGRLVCSQKRSA